MRQEGVSSAREPKTPREEILPSLDPRLVMVSGQSGASDPVRAYPDAGGRGGGRPSLSFPSFPERTFPAPSPGQIQGRPRKLALSANRINTSRLCAAIATISGLRDELWGRRAITFAANQAACAALTKGAAKDRLALTLIYVLWSTGAR